MMFILAYKGELRIDIECLGLPIQPFSTLGDVEGI